MFRYNSEYKSLLFLQVGIWEVKKFRSHKYTSIKTYTLQVSAINFTI